MNGLNTTIPNATTPTNIGGSTPIDVKVEGTQNLNLLIVTGAIALGIFVIGHTIFAVANYTALKNLRKQLDAERKQTPQI